MAPLCKKEPFSKTAPLRHLFGSTFISECWKIHIKWRQLELPYSIYLFIVEIYWMDKVLFIQYSFQQMQIFPYSLNDFFGRVEVTFLVMLILKWRRAIKHAKASDICIGCWLGMQRLIMDQIGNSPPIKVKTATLLLYCLRKLSFLWGVGALICDSWLAIFWVWS